MLLHIYLVFIFYFFCTVFSSSLFQYTLTDFVIIVLDQVYLETSILFFTVSRSSVFLHLSNAITRVHTDAALSVSRQSRSTFLLVTLSCLSFAPVYIVLVYIAELRLVCTVNHITSFWIDYKVSLHSYFHSKLTLTRNSLVFLLTRAEGNFIKRVIIRAKGDK